MRIDDKRAEEIGQKLVVTCGWCEHLRDEDCDGGWCRCAASEHCDQVRAIDSLPCGQYGCSDSYDDMIFEAATVDIPDLLADRAEREADATALRVQLEFAKRELVGLPTGEAQRYVHKYDLGVPGDSCLPLVVEDASRLRAELAVLKRALWLSCRSMLDACCPDGALRSRHNTRCEGTGGDCVQCFVEDGLRQARAELATKAEGPEDDQ